MEKQEDTEQTQKMPEGEHQSRIGGFILLAQNPSGSRETSALGVQNRREGKFIEVLTANLLAAYSEAILMALRLGKGKAKRGAHSSVIAGMFGITDIIIP